MAAHPTLQLPVLRVAQLLAMFWLKVPSACSLLDIYLSHLYYRNHVRLLFYLLCSTPVCVKGGEYQAVLSREFCDCSSILRFRAREWLNFSTPSSNLVRSF